MLLLLYPPCFRRMAQCYPSQHNQRRACPGLLSFADAAEQVLRCFGNHQPMHYQQITRHARGLGLIATDGQIPASSMYAVILTEFDDSTPPPKRRLCRSGIMPGRRSTPICRHGKRTPETAPRIFQEGSCAHCTIWVGTEDEHIIAYLARRVIWQPYAGRPFLRAPFRRHHIRKQQPVNRFHNIELLYSDRLSVAPWVWHQGWGLRLIAFARTQSSHGL